MIHPASANCLWCEHYQGERKCLAFPEQIPNDLWQGRNLHRQPVDGDQGYLYKRKLFEIPPFEE